MTRMKYAVAVAAMIAAATAGAQAVTPMEFEMQATMLAPNGIVTSCGVSFNGAAIRSGSAMEADQIAGSVAIHINAASMVKAGHQIAYLDKGKMTTRLVGDQVAWIRVEGGTPLAPLGGKIVPGDAPPYHLFGVDRESAISATASLLAGKTIWVGFTSQGVTSSIFSGRMKPDAGVVQQVQSCVNEMTAKRPTGR